MSYAIPGIDYEPMVAVQAQPDLIFIPRSRMQWLPFLVPLGFCGMSWMGGGIRRSLTDIGFLLFTILCFMFLTMEFVRFPRRFGIGGLVLWGGTLCWFCQDYFVHWFNAPFSGGTLTMKENGQLMSAVVVAKAAYLHVLFVMLMSVGLNITAGKMGRKAFADCSRSR